MVSSLIHSASLRCCSGKFVGRLQNQGDRPCMCMRSLQPSHFTDGSLPVFVFPQSLTFYADEQSSHKQVLTVYNPYEFALRFKVLCTAPSRYIVVDSDGIVKPRCCIDIVIRHTDTQANARQQDKFRLHIFEHGLQKVIGKKEIPAILQLSRRTSEVTQGNTGRPSVSIRRETPRSGTSTFGSQELSESGFASQQGPSLWVILMAVGCVVVLMLPVEGDKRTELSQYLLVSVNQKLLAAYVLGLITMAVLKM